MALATRNNLLKWYTDTPDTNAFPRTVEDCRTAALITYTGDTTSFYINLITPYDDGDTIGAVQLVKETTGGATTVTPTAGADALPDDKVAYYATVTTPAVGNGFYYWKITIDGTVYKSTRIQVMSQADALKNSIRIAFRHYTTKQGVRYPWFDPDGDFFQTARIPAYLINPDLIDSATVYTAMSTGQEERYNASQKKVLNFRTAFVDDDLYEGIAFALVHDQVTLNARRVVVKDAPTRTASQGILAPMSFSVTDQSYAEPIMP